MLKRFTLIALVLLASLALGQSVHVNDGGTLRDIEEIYVNDAGTLRTIREGYINDGGTLRQFFQLALLNDAVDGQDYSVVDEEVSVAIAAVTLQNDGSLTFTGNSVPANTQWLLGGEPSDFEARCQQISGVPDGSACNATWLDLSSSRTWSETQSGFGSDSSSITITIRHKVDTSNSISFDVIPLRAQVT